jgi:hypothetical protein
MSCRDAKDSRRSEQLGARQRTRGTVGYKRGATARQRPNGTDQKARVLGDSTAKELFPLLNYLLRFGTREYGPSHKICRREG